MIRQLIGVQRFTAPRYETPRQTDMAVILVYFNPAKSFRILQNLLLVKNMLDVANIPYFIAELAFMTREFEIPAASNVYHYRSTSYMFYKENLVNVALSRIPPEYTKLCLMDADIIFEDPSWYSIISKTLDTANVCKPFRKGYWLKANFCIDPVRTVGSDHNGYIWAVRREWFSTRGFFDMDPLGSGDLFFAISVSSTHATLDSRYAGLQAEYDKYLAKGAPTSVENAELTLYHLYHGGYTNRQYGRRDAILADILKKYDAVSIDQITERRDGMLVWRSDCEEYANAAILKQFIDRDDDGI